MITWGSIFILSVLLGVIISYVPSKWSWLLIIPITLLTLFVLNYYYDRLPTTSIGASMSELAYIFVGIPSISIALCSYFFKRNFRRS
jgi:uncharacterized membrane protein